MTLVYNRSDFTQRRKDLRNNAPASEQVVWTRLQGKKVHGLKFRRQYGIGPYVTDFYCPAVKLSVEIDGESHSTEHAIAYDHEREQYMESVGTTVLRFTNEQVKLNLDWVVEQIASTVSQLPRMPGAK